MTTVLDRLNELVHVAMEYGRLAGRKEFGPLSVREELLHQSSAAQSLALAQRIAGELQFKSEAPTGPVDHTLKTDPQTFQAVWDGIKTFEIRRNDRGFKAGDRLYLIETTHTGEEMAAGAPLKYTGRQAFRRVSHVLEGYGLQPGWCCLSFATAAGGASAGAAR